MQFSDELENNVAWIFRKAWTERDGTLVPESEDVKLDSNDAVRIDGAVLYADLAESTKLVDTESPSFAAEVYKAFLDCSSRIIGSEGGTVTAFDGDRVMGVFIGDTKNTSAARAALKINHAVRKIINPAIKRQYAQRTYEVRHSVGVDSGSLFAARTGIRGANDLVWVGAAANYAAKLCALRDGNYASWITHRVFNNMLDETKRWNEQEVWEARSWTAQNNMSVYRSHWTWSV